MGSDLNYGAFAAKGKADLVEMRHGAKAFPLGIRLMIRGCDANYRRGIVIPPSTTITWPVE